MYLRDAESALQAAARNRYWREADAEVVLSLWRDSGLTLGAFGRQWSINVARLRRWRDRLEGRDLPTFHPVRVVEADVAPSVRVADGGGVEIVVAGGRRVIARAGFDEATLVRVIHLLEGMRC